MPPAINPNSSCPPHPCPSPVWAWGGGVCDIPPKLNLPMPPDLKYGYRPHVKDGQMLFYVRAEG